MGADLQERSRQKHNIQFRRPGDKMSGHVSRTRRNKRVGEEAKGSSGDNNKPHQDAATDIGGGVVVAAGCRNGSESGEESGEESEETDLSGGQQQEHCSGSKCSRELTVPKSGHQRKEIPADIAKLESLRGLFDERRLRAKQELKQNQEVEESSFPFGFLSGNNELLFPELLFDDDENATCIVVDQRKERQEVVEEEEEEGAREKDDTRKFGGETQTKDLAGSYTIYMTRLGEQQCYHNNAIQVTCDLTTKTTTTTKPEQQHRHLASAHNTEKPTRDPSKTSTTRRVTNYDSDNNNEITSSSNGCNEDNRIYLQLSSLFSHYRSNLSRSSFNITTNHFERIPNLNHPNCLNSSSNSSSSLSSFSEQLLNYSCCCYRCLCCYSKRKFKSFACFRRAVNISKLLLTLLAVTYILSVELRCNEFARKTTSYFLTTTTTTTHFGAEFSCFSEENFEFASRDQIEGQPPIGYNHLNR